MKKIIVSVIILLTTIISFAQTQSNTPCWRGNAVRARYIKVKNNAWATAQQPCFDYPS